MKLSKRTVDILKNFSEINPSLYFQAGRKQSTLAPSKKIFATAEIEEEIERDFGIYELSKLLAASSIAKDPDFVAGESALTLRGDSNSFKIVYCSPDTIVHAAGKNLDLPSSDASFDLPAAALADFIKAAGVLSLPNVVFECDPSTGVSMTACDVKNPSSHNFRSTLSGDYSGTPLRLVFNAGVFRFLPGDYSVSLSKAKIARFAGDRVTYMVVAEAAE